MEAALGRAAYELFSAEGSSNKSQSPNSSSVIQRQPFGGTWDLLGRGRPVSPVR